MTSTTATCPRRTTHRFKKDSDAMGMKKSITTSITSDLSATADQLEKEDDDMFMKDGGERKGGALAAVGAGRRSRHAFDPAEFQKKQGGMTLPPL